jgi:hypothetical protein
MKKYESHPGVETPDTPDGSDELDACDVLRGLGFKCVGLGGGKYPGWPGGECLLFSRAVMGIVIGLMSLHTSFRTLE